MVWDIDFNAMGLHTAIHALAFAPALDCCSILTTS
jgi:hypothetical protein